MAGHRLVEPEPGNRGRSAAAEPGAHRDVRSNLNRQPGGGIAESLARKSECPFNPIFANERWAIDEGELQHVRCVGLDLHDPDSKVELNRYRQGIESGPEVTDRAWDDDVGSGATRRWGAWHDENTSLS